MMQIGSPETSKGDFIGKFATLSAKPAAEALDPVETAPDGGVPSFSALLSGLGKGEKPVVRRPNATAEIALPATPGKELPDAIAAPAKQTGKILPEVALSRHAPGAATPTEPEFAAAPTEPEFTAATPVAPKQAAPAVAAPAVAETSRQAMPERLQQLLGSAKAGTSEAAPAADTVEPVAAEGIEPMELTEDLELPAQPAAKAQPLPSAQPLPGAQPAEPKASDTALPKADAAPVQARTETVAKTETAPARRLTQTGGVVAAETGKPVRTDSAPVEATARTQKPSEAPETDASESIVAPLLQGLTAAQPASENVAAKATAETRPAPAPRPETARVSLARLAGRETALASEQAAAPAQAQAQAAPIAADPAHKAGIQAALARLSEQFGSPEKPAQPATAPSPIATGADLSAAQRPAHGVMGLSREWKPLVGAEAGPTDNTSQAGVIATTPAPATPPTMPGQPLPAQMPTRDFEQLVERLAQAREAARPASAEMKLDHAEFGQVNLRFDQGDKGLNVSMRSSDPDFAPTIRAALAGDAPRGDSNSQQSNAQANANAFQSQQGSSGQPQQQAHTNQGQAAARPQNAAGQRQDDAGQSASDQTDTPAGNARQRGILA